MIGFKLNRSEEKDLLLDESYYLWRYLDFNKLIYLLLNQEIIFSRLDSFNDPMEGLSLSEIEHIDHLEGLPDKRSINPLVGEKDVIREILQAKNSRHKQLKQYQKKSQKNQFASCWYKNDNQSWAMWKQYSNEDGFAIRINGKHLLEYLTIALNSYHIKNKTVADAMIGLVDYLPLWPFDRSEMYKHNTTLYSGFKKDLSYKHEGELRLIIVLNKIIRKKYLSLKMPLDSNIDIKIFANPMMENWKLENFKNLVKKLNIDVDLIEKSGLAYRKI